MRQFLPTQEFRRRTEAVANIRSSWRHDIDVMIADIVRSTSTATFPSRASIYRPGLTVRQAIALAGGYDVMRLRMNNPFLEQADLRSEYTSLWAEFAKEQMRIARLQAELEGKEESTARACEDASRSPVPRRSTAGAQIKCATPITPRKRPT